MKNKGIIILGPQGSGKTIITEAFISLLSTFVESYDDFDTFTASINRGRKRTTIVLIDGLTELPHIAKLMAVPDQFILISNATEVDTTEYEKHFTVLDFHRFMQPKRPTAQVTNYTLHNGVTIHNDVDYRCLITLLSDTALNTEWDYQVQLENEDAFSMCNDELRNRRPSEAPPQTDEVARPAHYTDGKIEVIDFIEDKQLGFHLGNTVKYVARAGKKDPSKEIQDLEKAAWYLNRRIENLKNLQ